MYPHERSLVKRLQDKPFALLGINSDRDKNELKKVLEKEQITWRSWWDGGGTSGPIASTWNVHGWPTIYVLDQKGVIRYKNVRGEKMEQAVDALLAEMNTGGGDSSDTDRRRHSQNNLKQIGLALHNYHDSFGKFPAAAITSKDGKPLLSWRVAILPYIEEEKLYREFKLDEPWDSPHNKPLLKKMPKIYEPLGVQTKEPNRTFYQAFVGIGAAFEGTDGTRIVQFLDGTSNTFLVAEAGEAVPWSKPDDLAFDPAKPLPELGGLFKDGFHALYADGSVRFVKKGVKEETLRALITRAGNEVLGADAP
jgi:hypothetical protein